MTVAGRDEYPSDSAAPLCSTFAFTFEDSLANAARRPYGIGLGVLTKEFIRARRISSVIPLHRPSQLLLVSKQRPESGPTINSRGFRAGNSILTSPISK